MPGAAASESFAQSQEVVAPLRIGSPELLPSGVPHLFASALVTFGMVPMSAYRASPARSVAIVLAQGMPWYFFRIDRICWVLDARAKPNQVLAARARLLALASAKANAVVLVHGRGMPSKLLKTGPYRVHQRVWVTGARVPFGCLASTVTVRGVIATALPFCRYSVGWPWTRVSWNGVDRQAVDVVWLHATFSLWPTRTSGMPYSDAPVTLILPGIVSCAW